MKFQNVKGTEDFYPQDKALQNSIFATLRRVATSYGFDEVESPAMETLALLTAKSGDEVKDQIFILEKRGSEELALRFDLTVPLTRMFVERQRELPKPTKWFGLSRMWRYERPQKGRMREFYQLSAELFGIDSAQGIAECLNLLIACLEELGVTSKDVVIRINNRNLLEGILRSLIGNASFADVVRVVDKKSKITEAEFNEELTQLGISTTNAKKIQQVTSIRGSMDEVKSAILKITSIQDLDSTGQRGLTDLDETIKMIPQEFVDIDLSIARGLAYYTGTVFEFFDRSGELRAIAGGGQYDQLTNVLGGQDCPAVGFGLGYSTLRLLLEKLGKLPSVSMAPEYFVGAIDKYSIGTVMQVANALRKTARVEVDFKLQKVPKQLSTAMKLGAKKFIVIGADEIASGKFKVKDLDSGTEKELRISQIVSRKA